jgi:two-component system, OmpR family, response regulator
VSTHEGQNARILIVDDDARMQRMLVDYLTEENMRPLPASGREEMLRYFAAGEPSLVLLDLRLERDDGLNLLREIKSRFEVPVIIITGHRRDEIDRVVGLELGADDYICKPFGLRELLARVRVVLRRQGGGQATTSRGPEAANYKFAGWFLDQRKRQLTSPSGEPVILTKSEYNLLVAFLVAPGRPLSREHLLQVTRMHEDIFDRSIDVQVLRLRRKLETDPSAPRIIQTERGVGYRFAVSVERL